MSDKEAGDLAETGGQGVPPLPEPDVEQGSRWLPSLVWLIPLLAALIGAGLAAKSILDHIFTCHTDFLTISLIQGPQALNDALISFMHEFAEEKNKYEILFE